MRFSQRIGKTPVRLDQQIKNIDPPLRNGLWNACYIAIFEPMQRTQSNWPTHFVENACHNFFKYPLDQLAPLPTGNIRWIREWFFAAEWSALYDFIEFLVQNWPQDDYNRDAIGSKREGFVAICNNVLERERSAYRVLENELVQVTDEHELKEIRDVLDNTKGTVFANANTHLRSAAALLFHRKAPDYPNSMKESILAVEATAAGIAAAPGTTLSAALRILQEKRRLHPALAKAFTALYAYTSDADGIRHALTTDQSSCDFVDAKFFFIACSAFVNYLIARTVATPD